jgi:hypothetical protein
MTFSLRVRDRGLHRCAAAYFNAREEQTLDQTGAGKTSCAQTT